MRNFQGLLFVLKRSCIYCIICMTAPLNNLKNKHSLPRYTHVRVSIRGYEMFIIKFGVLCFLVTPVLIFTLLPYYRRNLWVNLAHKWLNQTIHSDSFFLLKTWLTSQERLVVKEVKIFTFKTKISRSFFKDWLPLIFIIIPFQN